MFYKTTNLLLYLIILLLFIIVIYFSHYKVSIKEGINSSVCPSDNPVINSSNLEMFFYCKDWPISTVSSEIMVINNQLGKLQTPGKSYLLNIFTSDINTTSNLISSNSPLIGNNWNDSSANSLLNNTKTLITNDLRYLSYLTTKNSYNPPQYTAIPPSLLSAIGSSDSPSCSALSDPSGNSNVLTQLNQMLTQQQNRLATIQANIESIESRFPIEFQLGTVSVDKRPNASPKISITGDLPNPVLNFTLITPIDGPMGPSIGGPMGPAGPQGGSGLNGLDGYWGADDLPNTLFSSTT